MEEEAANSTVANQTTNDTMQQNTTSNESLKNQTSGNETEIIFKNETESEEEETVKNGMSLKFNNYFEYAIGSTNNSGQGQCQKECQQQYPNQSMCCVSVKMFPKDQDYLFT